MMRVQVAKVTASVNQNRSLAERSIQMALGVVLDITGVGDDNATATKVGSLSKPDCRVSDIRVSREVDERTAPPLRDQWIQGIN